jgi:FAD-dependent urate hydroxylase
MNIAIIGAGIGGLTAALALATAGHRIRIYERRSTPASPGAGYVLWPNAMFVLRQLGLSDAVVARGGKLALMNRYDARGQLLTSLDLSALAQLMGQDCYAILRTDLLALLLEAVQAHPIPVYFDNELTHVESRQNVALARFSQGIACTADLLIGADGRMDSRCRQFVLGDNHPSYQGFANWVGYVEARLPELDSPAVSDYWGYGERFGIVHAGADKYYWAAGAAVERNSEAFANIRQHKTDKTIQRMLLDRFAQWPAAIHQIIAATDTRQINSILVHDLPPQAPWYKDRVLLLGDAAHACLPTSGQGACQAIEDSWHLANCLQGCDGKSIADIRRRLEHFQQLRFDKTASITRSARHLANQLFSTDPEVCAQRNYQAKASDPTNAIRGMASLWSQGLPLSSRH